MNGKLSAGALLNMLIQAATNSADSLNFGYQELKTKNLFWVLSRISIELTHLPNWNESITIETWPKDQKGLLYIRDFFIKNQNNTVIGKASSAWLAIHSQTKRPKVIPDLVRPFEELKNYHALEELPLKIEEFNGKIVSERMAVFSDIDINSHLTSARYIDWLTDSIEFDYHAGHSLTKLSINYIQETVPGQSIEIKRGDLNDGFLFEGNNIRDKKISFRAKLNYSEI